MPLVLLVDDDPAVRSALARFVGRLGHEVAQACDGAEGVSAIHRINPDLVITDMEMPGGTGFVVLEAGMKARVPVVILTAHASVEMAVDAMKRGAANFLTKPFTADTVAQMLQEAFGARQERRREARAAGDGSAVVGPGGPVGEDEAFRGVLGIVERVADTDATILLTGESGTGKEVVARAIHNASKRRDKAFVAVNCGAIPEALLESELFGHVRGAFTGATQARRGRFQVAEGGTLFLDEIGDMPAALQVKLLRVIQERQYEVLGESRPQPANVRFIAATHRNLERMVADGKFRDDLYYRLNVVPLHLPPLRERQRDIPLLVKHFIGEANAAHAREVTGIAPDAMALLTGYSWPGNVRELANIVERMVLLKGQGVLDAADVPPQLRPQQTAGSSGGRGATLELPSNGIDLTEALLKWEGVLIEQALERTRGNRTQAAALLRINRTTLVEKLKRRDESGPESEDD
ncbi:MAG TPA: sigma-54 dependent transcriptional regulator [Polyangiaceae bacterium]|nr:sigma-54 dependent transcriptional regulator [Polyangiaceae bacterium]